MRLQNLSALGRFSVYSVFIVYIKQLFTGKVLCNFDFRENSERKIET
jgi:hypothetical protein